MSDHDPPDGQSFVLRVVENINDFTEDEWNSIAGTSRQEQNYNPFISRAFLAALEQSGCVSRKAGRLPRHLRLEDDQGNLIGAVPNYLKGHSQGEYVFDHGWADAFERAGGRYYPKFQAAVPFTPATGPRLLNHIAYDNHAVRLALAGGLRELADQSGVSSAHVTFAPADEIPALEKAGFLHRTDQQFHFINNGFLSYDDFLNELVSRKRKALRKERREAHAEGIEIDWLTGHDEHKLRVVEAGAQGEHKLARGYVPVTTHSAHYLANESFRNAVRNYLDSERREVEHIHAALEEHSPYRKA
ncbi:peptidogalycan biosysnthesis protein [Brucella melitensis]|uniref:peptidogalycan biosysnthesis protein n=1 Tax=Brucella melitensis TaxID=29459 RepID=UPI0002CDC436|nr:peptidogalycan biosysnthesis protein [Brucella melitensis]ENS77000.1 hypothetical protein C060_00788 [Brucella melitensis UK22/04]